MKKYDGGIEDIAISPDNQLIASSSTCHKLIIWDLSSFQIHKEIDIGDFIYSVKFSLDGKYIAVSNFLTVYIIHVDTWTVTKEFDQHTHIIDDLQFTPDSNFLITACTDTYIRAFNMNTRELSYSFKVQGDFQKSDDPNISNIVTAFDSIAISSDGKYLIAANGIIAHLWDLNIGKKIYQFPIIEKPKLTGYKSVSFSFDNNKIAFGMGDGSLRLWDINDEKWYGLILPEIYDDLFYREKLKILKLSNFQEKLKRAFDSKNKYLKSHTATINSIIFTSDSKYLITASHDETIRIWDFETLKHLAVLKGHTSWVNSIAITNDDKTLISCSRGIYEGTIRIWDITTIG